MSDIVKREDLVVPYHHVPAKPRGNVGGLMEQSLPMAAMFLKNKLLSWSALFLAIQSYLSEPNNKPDTDEQARQPPLLRVVFALIALVTCYIEFIFPSANPQIKRTAAGKVAETVSSSIAAATSTK
ncbi:hypothetical protein QCA50_016242 [Cerrena zonata]|uniref:Uncharacterized protein n=1 Tax=Cerrena zonata TaxID=2478898 RepID=A0AAW0FNT2_9APHY